MFIAAGSSGSSMISETVASNALPASDDDIISRNSSKKRGKRGSLSKSQSVTKERKQQDLVVLHDKKPQQYITSKVKKTNRILPVRPKLLHEGQAREIVFYYFMAGSLY